MANESSLKVYVPVDVRFDETGRMLPHAIIWEDGTKYEIDKVTDIRPAPAQKAGGQGDRYTVRIGGKQSYLFFERAATVTGCSLGRWFVERKIDLERWGCGRIPGPPVTVAHWNPLYCNPQFPSILQRTQPA